MTSSANICYNDGACDVTGRSRVGIDELAHLVCRGGWPQSVLAKTPRAAYVKSSSYVDEVVHEDVHRVDGIERNPDRVRNLLKSLARNISTLTTSETILQDLKHPSFLMVLTGTDLGYTRNDGVIVCPLGCLKP